MGKIDTLFKKNFSWYRKWSKFRYSNSIHFLVFVLMVFVNIALLLELRQEIDVVEQYYYALL